jgi:HEAT repeat
MFHDAIRGAVPEICELLTDSRWSVRLAGANAIGKLAEHGV